MSLSDQNRGLPGAVRARAWRYRVRLVVGVVAVFVTVVSVIHAPAAGAILEAPEIGTRADMDQSPGIDDCLECGEECVQNVTCTVYGIVGNTNLVPFAAKRAWIGAVAEHGPSRATAPPLRPPVTGFERSRKPS